MAILIRFSAFTLVLLLALQPGTSFSIQRSYRDIFSSNQQYGHKNQLAAQLYLQDLISPFLKRSYLDETIQKRSEVTDKDRPCTQRSGIRYNSPTTASLDVRFPGVRTEKNDEYMCTGYRVPFDGAESFIVSFTPHADMDQSHHMLVYGCEEVQDKDYWQNCWNPCMNKQTLYAWARNAPELVLPKNVGYSIGAGSKIKYIVVQMHFAKSFEQPSCAGVTAHVTLETQKYYAGIYLLGAGNINLPPHSSNVPASTVCMNGIPDPLHVFAFRTHAHMLANVITGYRARDGKFKMLGKGNPKWPQSFYPRVGGEIDLHPGDMISLQCLYNNTRDKVVHAGPSGGDEMCNLYLMFYTANPNVLKDDLECWDEYSEMNYNHFEFPSDVKQLAPYPGYAGEDSRKAIADGTATMPQVPEEHEHHHGHSDEHEGQDEDAEILAGEDSDMDGGDTEFNELLKKANISEALSRSHGMPDSEGLKVNLNWPHLDQDHVIGAVGGVAADENGDLHVFHRGSRVWDASSFDSHNRFTQPNNSILEDVVYHISKESGNLLHSWGGGQFFMPHGLSLDPDGFIWLTDVALHQALKYPPGGAAKPLLTLGTRMEPGSTIDHFCKPTDVAVDSDGMIYVSDGYCNGRVMKFDREGRFVKKWGRMVTTMDLLNPPTPTGVFFVAHSIILCGPQKDEICVADRENGRIQCFTKNGDFTRIIEDKEKTGNRVFAITYSPMDGGLIYGVNGPNPQTHDLVGGFTLQYSTGQFIERWEPSSLLSDPHDLAASPSGEVVYVGELTKKKIYRFDDIPSASPVDAGIAGEKEDGTEELLINPDEMGSMDKKSGIVEENEERLNQNEESIEMKPPDTSFLEESEKNEIEPSIDEAGSATIIIIILLILPTIAILTAFVCIRIRARRLKEYQGLLSTNGKPNLHQKKSLNLGNLLKRSGPNKKGFTIVQSDDSEAEDFEDSDVEVYSKKEPNMEVEADDKSVERGQH